MSNKPAVEETCPRCGASVESIPLPEGDGILKECSVCTWPNVSFKRIQTRLHQNTPDNTLDPDALEDFAAGLVGSTTLTDPQGRVVMAKALEVIIQDGAVDVTFEFDPKGWTEPSNLN